MEDLKICRICLRQDAKVYRSNQFQLKWCYQELTALIVNILTQMTKSDMLPHYFCYECAALLHKFIKFRQKCYKGLKDLRELLVCGKITQYPVSRLNSLSYEPTLEILTVSEHVKTFTIIDQETMNIQPRAIDEATSTKAMIADNIEKVETVFESPEDILICPKLEPIETPLNPEDQLTGNTDDGCNPPREEQSNSLASEYIHTMVIKTEEITDDDDDGEKSIDIEINCDDDVFAHQRIDIDMNLLKVKVEENPETTKNIVKKNVSGKEIQQSQKKKVEDLRKNSHQRSDVDTNLLKVKGNLESTKNIVKKNLSDKEMEQGQKKVEGVRKNLEEKKYRFTIKKRKSLDLSKWRIISLSDEDALREFENKASEPKYVEAAYRCTKCYKFFSTEDIMNRHMKLKHGVSEGHFECRFCKTRFRLEYQMKRHIRIHYTKYQCLVCHLVVAIEPTALMHEETHSGVMRTCKYCGVEFRHITSYYSHLRTHRTRHVCSTCGASFVSEAGLHQHRRVRHVDDQPKPQTAGQMYCDRCQIKFETLAAYEEHLNSSALHVEVAKSDYEEIPASKKKYRSRSDRKTWKKPTTCNQCGKHFATQAQCMIHHQIEHPRTPFHNPNERTICEICGASLAPGSIATHNNTHTKEKMYSCNTCGRKFCASTSLKRHLVTHTGEKPFKCPLCDKRFTQDSSMKLHYRTFHLKEPYPRRNRSKKKEETQQSSPIAS